MNRLHLPPSAERGSEFARRKVAAGRAWWRQSIGGRGLERIRELNLDTHALALCAQQVLCTAPLLFAVAAVLRRAGDEGVPFLLVRFFGLHDDSARDVEKLFSGTSMSISTPSLVFWMVVAVFFMTSVASVQQRAFELIWTLPRIISVRSYLRQLIWSLVLIGWSVVLLFVGKTGRSFHHQAHRPAIVLAAVVSGVLTFLFYWWSQHYLLAGRVTWRALFPGSVAVGIGTAVVFRLTRVIMPGSISWQVHAYGLIGAVFVMSVWLMILSTVVFGGILLGALITERRVAKEHTDPGRVPESPLTEAGLASAAEADLPVEAGRR